MGVNFMLDYRNYIDRQLLMYGFYERDRLDKLSALITTHHAKHFIDIGSNYGLYSMVIANKFPDLGILAYEADKRNFDHFSAHLRLNKLSYRIKPQLIALSNCKGVVSFARADETVTGQSKITNDKTGYSVNALPLDDLVNLKNEVIALKIDVEGHEVFVIEGAKNLLKNNQCVLQIESFSNIADDLKNIMADMGYRHIDVIEDDHYFSNIV